MVYAPAHVALAVAAAWWYLLKTIKFCEVIKMAVSHGGARPNSGRKPQSETVKKVDAKLKNAGILPLEMRLKVARKLWADATDAEGEITDMAKAKEAADFAEPAMQFTSTRLQAVAHTGSDGSPIDFRISHAKESLMRKLGGFEADGSEEADRRPN